MVISPRRTRSRSKQLSGSQGHDQALTLQSAKHETESVEGKAAVNDLQPSKLPSTLTTRLTQLSKPDLQTLHTKRQWLRSYTPAFSEGNNASPPVHLANALQATLVFAQEEAGTAVCISSTGLILTCSHCIAENEAELADSRMSWLIFASGQVVKTECIAWDAKRDLALCYIIGVEDHPIAISAAGTSRGSFPSAPIASKAPRFATPLMCVGHPGSEDLESVVPGVKTNYDTLYVSYGKYRGYAPGQDIHNNEDIGALRHDCWTYWGHSGAPLIVKENGTLVGLHSSWDDSTGMRRGIGLEAIRSFLRENLDVVQAKTTDTEGLLDKLR